MHRLLQIKAFLSRLTNTIPVIVYCRIIYSIFFLGQNECSRINHCIHFLSNYTSGKFSSARSPVRVIVQVQRTFNGIAGLCGQKRSVQIHSVKASSGKRIENLLAVRLESDRVRVVRGISNGIPRSILGSIRSAPCQLFRINARLARRNHHQEFHALRLELVAELFNRRNRVVEFRRTHIKRRRLHQEFYILAVEKPTVRSHRRIASARLANALARRAKHHLFARIAKDFPHRKLILWS